MQEVFWGVGVLFEGLSKVGLGKGGSGLALQLQESRQQVP